MFFYISHCIDQILEELMQAGGETFCSEIHKLVNSYWNKEKLPEQWNEFVIVLLYKKAGKTDCSNYQ
jgi:hypothetical protein